MKEIRKQLSELLADAGRYDGYRFDGKSSEICSITDDTRCVENGSVFVCVKGNSFDGHSAAADMLDRGAAAVVCDHDLGLGDRQIIVENTRRFYGHLTAAWYDHPENELTLIGITGTNGKTTMATMIHSIISSTGEKVGIIGTAGTFIGNEPVERDESTPTTPKVGELFAIFREMADKKCGYCVMEVSSFALEQNRIGPAVFECAVFTNLTRDHLDYHKTMENYYLAKKKLFTEHCRYALINTEDSYGKRLFDEIGAEKQSYGIKGGTDIYASCIKYVDGAARFWFCHNDKSYPFTLKMMGSYNIANAAAAAAVCCRLGISMEKITEAVSSFKGVRGRCELVPTGRDFHIVCDYAHSPDALENMLPAIKENTEGRLICLFGCGGDRDRTKRPLMAQAAAEYADHLIITSDNPRNEDPDAIIDEITAGLDGKDISYDRITDRREAIFHAVQIARKGDVIVLAGKGHEDYQILSGNVHIHFDEREVCAEALEARSECEMSLDEIAAACGGRLVGVADGNIRINAHEVSSDTRTITKGCLFIAFIGERFDGHDFVPDAVSKGAVAAVTSRPVEGQPCIVTEDTNRAIMQLAAYYRSRFAPKLVGITGSVGKTTTKEMTALALSAAYDTLKTEGNRNNEIGMPFTLLRLTSEHKAAVIEMGMSHFGEIERLSKVCRPEICIITNIGWSHAENLGSQQGILKAKLEILEGAAPSAPLIINGDDPLLVPLKASITDRRVITCAAESRNADYYADNICVCGGCTSFDIVCGGKCIDHISLPCIGMHHVLDAVIAYAAATEAGVKDGIAEKLSTFRLDGLRQHIEHKGGHTLVVDCYNAAPASMKAAIDVLCSIEPDGNGRRAAVLGDMLELGENSVHLHKEVGRYAAEKGISLVICCGSQAKYIAEGAAEAGTETFWSDSKETVTDFMREHLREGDAVLYKASRGIHMEEIISSYYGE